MQAAHKLTGDNRLLLGAPCPAPRACRLQTACRSNTETSTSGRDQQCCRSSLLRQGLKVSTFGALATGIATQSAVAQSPIAVPESGKVAMRTLAGSELAIGFYPKFIYNSSGGGGIASAARNGSSRINLQFDPAKVSIPDVTGKSTTFLGAPMLPYLRIAIQPTKLEGSMDRDTGEVELYFDAMFNFTAGSIYKSAKFRSQCQTGNCTKAPPLLVKTRLTTESVSSRHHRRTGERLDSNGFATLTGVADIQPTGDAFMDGFLQLPTDVLAVMKSQFSLQ